MWNCFLGVYIIIGLMVAGFSIGMAISIIETCNYSMVRKIVIQLGFTIIGIIVGITWPFAAPLFLAYISGKENL